MPTAQLEALGAVHDGTRSLTPPGVAVADATGAGPTEVNSAVTELQNVLFAANSDVVRRFAQLQDGVGAFVAWLGDLISNIDEVEREEPWELAGGAPKVLARSHGKRKAASAGPKPS